ncbi:enoyl-CoA hydratase/isomerase family protein [Kribbella antibiotica]|uniref:Enoyl-CoA hydratase/isomerase family protein n=1 Tax=Kribbella antibiotica TaxID=190195 RepID=A0A4R4ZY38_9ACTN|nr:enoyl-CoA hydratase/isomerase family protein [Kribbella antibiotica]TDD63274.1 enoyl-CoA hydratase/isomerase family protein [Kribbella antibiotica]
MPADPSLNGTVVCEAVDGIATVTLDHPGKCNALTMSMWRDLDRVLRDLSDDPRILTIVIRGEGADFSAGADIDDLPDDPDEFHRVHLATEQTIARLPKPVIAAVRGSCVGGGCEIAVAADFRFADATARFGVTASRLGIVYPYAPTHRLIGLVGLGNTRRLLYAGELLDATWAERVGLITELTTEDVDKRALDFARLLTTRSQTTIAAAKQITAGTHSDLAWPDSDYTEGVNAFRARRKPVFPSAHQFLPGG